MEQVGACVGWSCACGKRNAPGSQFCPGCGGAQAAGELILLDHTPTAPPGIELGRPGRWDLGMLLARCAPYVRRTWAWTSPRARKVWLRSGPVRELLAGLVSRESGQGSPTGTFRRYGYPALRCLAVVAGAWTTLESFPTPWTATRAVHATIRSKLPTDAAVAFAKQEQVAQIANYSGQPWVVSGTVFFAPTEGIRAAPFRGTAHWEGFPGRYWVSVEFGGVGAVTPAQRAAAVR